MTHGILVRPTGDTLLLRYPDSGDVSAWIEKQIGGAPEKFSIGAGIVAFSRRRGPLNEPVRRILSENAAVHGDALVLKLAKRRKRMGIANGCVKFIKSTAVPGTLVIAEDEEES